MSVPLLTIMFLLTETIVILKHVSDLPVDRSGHLHLASLMILTDPFKWKHEHGIDQLQLENFGLKKSLDKPSRVIFGP